MKKTLGIIAMLLIVAMLSVVFVSCKPGPDAEQPAPPAPPAEPVLEGTDKGTLQIEMPAAGDNEKVTWYLDGNTNVTAEGISQPYYLTVKTAVEDAVEVTQEKYDNNTFRFSIGEGESKKYINIVEENVAEEGKTPNWKLNTLYQEAPTTFYTKDPDTGMLYVMMTLHKKKSQELNDFEDTCYIGNSRKKTDQTPFTNVSAQKKPETLNPDLNFIATFVPAPEPDPTPAPDPAPETDPAPEA